MIPMSRNQKCRPYDMRTAPWQAMPGKYDVDAMLKKLYYNNRIYLHILSNM